MKQIGSASFRAHEGEAHALARFKEQATTAGDGWIEANGFAFTLYERSDDWCATGFAYCADPQPVPRVDVAAAIVDLAGIPAGHVSIVR